jgi:hypothetical protein
MIFFKIPNVVAGEQEVANSAKTLVSPNKTHVFVNKNEVRLTTTAREIHLFPSVRIQRNKDIYVTELTLTYLTYSQTHIILV